MKTIQTCDELNSLEGYNFVQVRGTLTQEPFVNKVGKVNPNIIEWVLFLADGCRIYLRYDKALTEQFNTFRDQTVELTGSIFFGQIDSDDPNVQSRVGHMLNVRSIAKTD